MAQRTRMTEAAASREGDLQAFRKQFQAVQDHSALTQMRTDIDRLRKQNVGLIIEYQAREGRFRSVSTKMQVFRARESLPTGANPRYESLFKRANGRLARLTAEVETLRSGVSSLKAELSAEKLLHS